MFVNVKAAEGRRVWVGTAPLSNEIWQTVPLTASLVKAIKNGDVIEGTEGGDNAVNVGESLAAADAANETAAAAAAEANAPEDEAGTLEQPPVQNP